MIELGLLRNLRRITASSLSFIFTHRVARWPQSKPLLVFVERGGTIRTTRLDSRKRRRIPACSLAFCRLSVCSWGDDGEALYRGRCVLAVLSTTTCSNNRSDEDMGCFTTAARRITYSAIAREQQEHFSGENRRILFNRAYGCHFGAVVYPSRQQHVYLVVVGALSSLSVGEKNRMKEPILSAASAEGAVETPLLLFVMVSCLSEPLRLTHPLLQ